MGYLVRYSFHNVYSPASQSARVLTAIHELYQSETIERLVYQYPTIASHKVSERTNTKASSAQHSPVLILSKYIGIKNLCSFVQEIILNLTAFLPSSC